MKNEKKADAVLEKMSETEEKEILAQLMDVVWQAIQRCRKIKIVHHALWHFSNDVCNDSLELYEMLRMLKHHQDRLEGSLSEASKYCDDLEKKKPPIRDTRVGRR